MKKFAFRLRKVRSFRRQEEKAARVVLAGAVAHLARCDDQVATIAATIEECRAHATAAPSVAVLAQALLRGAERAASRARAARELAARQAADAREIWLHRRSAAAAIDKLHDARRAAWRDDVARAEQAELEEAARVVRLLAVRRDAVAVGEGEANLQ